MINVDFIGEMPDDNPDSQQPHALYNEAITDDFDFLGGLPEDKSAHKASEINTPLSSRTAGSGQELGEFGLGGFEDSNSSVVTDTAFKPLTPTEASFDPRLAFEMALGFDRPEDIYPRYGMDSEQWYAVARQPAFKNSVLKYQDEIQDQGISFRMKARVQAESYLKDAHLLIKHPLTPPSVKADMIKWTTKVADLEPKRDQNETGTTFNLQINL